MNSQEVLRREMQRWSNLSFDDLIDALRDTPQYQVENHEVKLKVLEITEKYLHIAIAVGGHSHSFFRPTT